MSERRLRTDSETNRKLMGKFKAKDIFMKKVRMFCAVIIATAFISSAVTLTISADGPTGFGTVIEPGSMVSEADYIIFSDGIGFFAKNGQTGEVCISGVTFTATLQGAIDLLTDGGAIYVSKGDYMTSTTVNIPSNLTVSGAGPQTIIRAGANSYNVFQSVENTSMHISQLQIIGGGAGSLANNAHCIYFEYVDNSTITDCWLSSSGEGFECEYSSDLTVSNVFAWANEGAGLEMDTGSRRIMFYGNTVFENQVDGIQVDEVYDCGVVSNNVFNNGGAVPADSGMGVAVLNSEGIVVTGNVISYSERAAVNIYLSSRTSVSGNTLNFNEWGVYAQGADNCTIASNIIFDNNNDGIELITAFAVRSDRCIISANIIINNGEGGIYLDYVDNSTIIGNHIFDNTMNGIYLIRDCDANIITGNHIIDNDAGNTGTYDGIKVATGSGNNLIEGNTIGVTTAGVLQRFPVRINSADCYNNVILSNNLLSAGKSASSIKLSDAGTNSVVKYNIGWATEKSGAATISGAVNIVAITHGLITTPVIVIVTGNNSGIGNYTVTAVTTTNFTITFENQPGVSSWKFYWYAQTW